MPGGGPTKYDPSYCQMLLDHAAEGKSIRSFAGKLRVARSTIYKWAEDNPEFSDTMAQAKEVCFQWWEERGIEGMEKQIFRDSIWKYNMANRFGWSERREEKVNSEQTININVSEEDTEL